MQTLCAFLDFKCAKCIGCMFKLGLLMLHKFTSNILVQFVIIGVNFIKHTIKLNHFILDFVVCLVMKNVVQNQMLILHACKCINVQIYCFSLIHQYIVCKFIGFLIICSYKIVQDQMTIYALLYVYTRTCKNVQLYIYINLLIILNENQWVFFKLDDNITYMFRQHANICYFLNKYIILFCVKIKQYTKYVCLLYFLNIK
eukprot:TRINITY_DN3698_c1_g1_i2.p2 TRINITY_DN3698_c1_g1~~TRINITY_DN3698_c1_g1_i2.p2  ORF type:complete len:200 (+),score=-27.70 TRINITY_DN3698_c1_g1_i2:169-768(+)